ncbi:MAG: ABC transporter permease [Candidatus Promineifilaceae bacterium]
MRSRWTLRQGLLWAWPLVPVLGALLFTFGLLPLFGASPFESGEAFFNGAFGDASKRLMLLAFWVPLVITSIGLLVTFTAGLWNIGVEGQIIMGAIAASFIALKVNAPPAVLIILELTLAMVAGGLWAALSAVLKTRGRVHEIFSGLALNAIAVILTNYLISGPWQPPEGGSFRGTEPFQDGALLPLLGDSRFSLLSLILAIAAFVLVFITLRGTFWGLKLKALGKNPFSSFLLGVSSERETILAMMFCGALAGLAGSIRVLSWFDSLRQSISGGIGFLALMVVMLATYRILLVPFVALFFAAVLRGSNTLHLRTQLHTSLGGILTGVMVLFVLLFGDAKRLGLFQAKKDDHGGGPEVSGRALDPFGKDIPQGE